MRRVALTLCLAACAAPKQSAPPAKAKAHAAAPAKSVAPQKRVSKQRTVSIKVDATLDADALVSALQKKLNVAAFRLVADTDARFFITFKIKETQTAAPPPGQEIARVQFVVSTLDRKEGIKLPQHTGDEDGYGTTLDAALDAALSAVADKVTPQLIAEMVGRLAADE